MTTTTLPRPLPPSMSAPPKPAYPTAPASAPAPAPAVSPAANAAASASEASLARVVGEAALDAVVDSAIDAACLPKAFAEDTFALGRGLYMTARVATNETASADLDVDETQKVELTGKASLKVGAFAEMKGAVSVEKQAKGYAVEASLEASAGVGANLSSNVDAELSGVVGVKVTFQAKDAAAADAKMKDLKWAALEGVAAVGRPTMLGMPAGIAAVASAFDDELLTASSVTTTLAGKAAADVSLWKHEAAGEAGAELGLDLEASAQLAMTVTNEGGKMRATFEGRATVSAEASLALQNDDHAMAPSALDFSFNGASEEVSVVQRVSYDLAPDFDMKNATNVLYVRGAKMGVERTEYAIETSVRLDDHQVSAKLAVAGGLDNAMVVAAATLGVDAAVERARSIKVTGEVERSRVTTSDATIDIKGTVEVELANETSKKLESAKVTDVRAFVSETAKAIVRPDVDPTVARINALR